MPGNWPVPFGKGPSEKDPHHGNLVGGLLHSEGAARKRPGFTQCEHGTSPGGPPYQESRPAREDGRAVYMGEGTQVLRSARTVRYARCEMPQPYWRSFVNAAEEGRKHQPEWVTRMATRRRKTLVVCRACHEDIHAGHPPRRSR